MALNNPIAPHVFNRNEETKSSHSEKIKIFIFIRLNERYLELSFELLFGRYFFVGKSFATSKIFRKFRKLNQVLKIE